MSAIQIRKRVLYIIFLTSNVLFVKYFYFCRGFLCRYMKCLKNLIKFVSFLLRCFMNTTHQQHIYLVWSSVRSWKPHWSFKPENAPSILALALQTLKIQAWLSVNSSQACTQIQRLNHIHWPHFYCHCNEILHARDVSLAVIVSVHWQYNWMRTLKVKFCV